MGGVRIAAAAVAAWLLVAGYRRLALRRGILDRPNERSSHTLPTPRGGGVGLTLAGIACALGLGGGLTQWWLLAALLVIAGLGFVDDLRNLGSGLRFGIQLATAGVLLWLLPHGSSVELPVVGAIALGPLAVPLWLFWVVGFANAFNFMDGIDGIAGAQASIALLVWWLVLPGDASLVAGSFAGASLGFLIHNWSPARIFMGDSGSVTLGFLLAHLGAQHSASDPRFGTLALVVVWPFAVDSGLTLARRLVRGENILRPHRSHTYQRLVQSGVSHGRVAALYAACAGLTGSVGYGWLRHGLGGGWLLLSLAAAGAGPFALLALRAHSVRARRM